MNHFSYGNTKPYRVAVCMWYDKPIQEYANIAYKINKKYCDSHGYDLLYSNKRLLPQRHPAWERFPMMLDVLNTNNYDYVLWIDADACFVKHSKLRLDDILEHHNDKDILFSSDNNSNENIPINTGVMILKNTQYSRQFLAKVIYSDHIEQCRSRFKKRLWEQDCVTHFFNTDDELREKSVVIDYGILQLFSSDYVDDSGVSPLVYHFMSLPNSERLEKLEFFMTYGLILETK